MNSYAVWDAAIFLLNLLAFLLMGLQACAIVARPAAAHYAGVTNKRHRKAANYRRWAEILIFLQSQRTLEVRGANEGRRS